MFKKLTLAAGLTLAFLMVSGIGSATYAQGRSGGRAAGPPSNPGVNTGLGTASGRSNGRSDTGIGTASTNSNGRSDAGLDRARLGRGNASLPGDNELNRYQGIARKLGTTPTALSQQYQAALLANPDLQFGQFVAANVVADNLGGRYPNLTASNILLGLQNGGSLGQTLRSLGVGSDEAKRVEKNAKRQIDESKKNR